MLSEREEPQLSLSETASMRVSIQPYMPGADAQQSGLRSKKICVPKIPNQEAKKPINDFLCCAVDTKKCAQGVTGLMRRRTLLFGQFQGFMIDWHGTAPAKQEVYT